MNFSGLGCHPFIIPRKMGISILRSLLDFRFLGKGIFSLPKFHGLPMMILRDGVRKKINPNRLTCQMDNPSGYYCGSRVEELSIIGQSSRIRIDYTGGKP